MNLEKILSYAGGAFFLLYGMGFSLFPHELASMIVDGIPTSTSASIDMRSTYGGMSAAIGSFLLYLAGKQTTVRLAVLGLMVLMIGMASARLLGFALDGSPNAFMLLYLSLEILIAAACGYAIYSANRRTN